MASFKDALTRLARPPEDARAENLRHWASSLGECTPIADVEPRRTHRVAGVVEKIRIDPRQGRGSIEATVADGTGHLAARWLGRHALQGITLGVGLVLEGTIGVEEKGTVVVLNPDYTLVPGPHQG